VGGGLFVHPLIDDTVRDISHDENMARLPGVKKNPEAEIVKHYWHLEAGK
jgi:hypothetical protein